MGIFALRNTREILRDPVNLGFGLGFPLALLLLLHQLSGACPFVFLIPGNKRRQHRFLCRL